MPPAPDARSVTISKTRLSAAIGLLIVFVAGCIFAVECDREGEAPKLALSICVGLCIIAVAIIACFKPRKTDH